jgi:hypothetical protein
VALGLAPVGCGSEKTIPPAGPMTPPGPGAEQEGGGPTKAKQPKAQTAEEK